MTADLNQHGTQNETLWYTTMHCSSRVFNHSVTCQYPSPNQFSVFPLPMVIHFVGMLVLVFLTVIRRRLFSNLTWLILVLTVTDITTTVWCLPIDIQVLKNLRLIFGMFCCSIYYPIVSATIFCVLFTLVTITHSQQHRALNGRRQTVLTSLKIILCVIWILSFILIASLVVISKKTKESRTCYEEWTVQNQHTYSVLIYFVGYALPLGSVTTAYGYILYEMSLLRKKIVFEKSSTVGG